MSVSRSRVAVFCAVLSLLLVACSESGNGTSGPTDKRELLVYHSMSPDEIAPMFAGFKQYYLDEFGVEVDMQEYHQPGGELQATLDLEAQAGEVRADVIVNSNPNMIRLQDDHGTLEPVSLGELDDEAIPESFRSVSEDLGIIPLGIQPYILAYNTEKVAPNEVPASWADLLDDRWNGLIGMGDPETTNGAHITVWFLAKHLADTVGSPFGWEYFDRLGELGITTASSHDNIMEYIASGELHVGILGLGTAIHSAEGGNPVAATAPAEGLSGIPVALGVVKGSPDADIAQAFALWSATQAGQIAMRDGSGFLSIRTDVDPIEAPFDIDIDVSKVFPLDDRWVAEERDANIARFRQALGR